MFERDGRRMRLTPQALDFLERARPLVADLRALTRKRPLRPCDGLILAMSESIASSWGPSAIRTASSKLGNPDIAIHVEPGALALESVRLGRTDVALCTSPRNAGDLEEHAIAEEPMVLLHSKLRTSFDARAPLVLIESKSATWLSTERALEARHIDLLQGEIVRVASFTMMLQMVKAGFGNGVLPSGHSTMTMPLPDGCRTRLDGVTRPVRLHGRRANRSECVAALHEHLAAAAATLIGIP